MNCQLHEYLACWPSYAACLLCHCLLTCTLSPITMLLQGGICTLVDCAGARAIRVWVWQQRRSAYTPLKARRISVATLRSHRRRCGELW